MRNPPGPYKHSGASDTDYSKSADSSLLSKGRKNFASGGSVPPYAKWLGAGPESYPAMRAEMSPSDFAIYKASVPADEYNRFMGISSPASPARAAPATPSDNPSVNSLMKMLADTGADQPTKTALANRGSNTTVNTTLANRAITPPYRMMAKGGLVKKGK